MHKAIKLIIVILLAFHSLADAQKNYYLKTGHQQIDALLEKTIVLEYRNPKTALKCIDSALNIARNQKPLMDTFPLYFEKGYHYYMVSNYSEAIKIYDKCLSHFKEEKDAFSISLCYLRIAYANARINNSEIAYKQAIDAIKYFESVNDSIYIALSNNILGVIFRMQRDFEKSDEYFNKILSYKSDNMINIIGRAYENLGVNYCIKGDFSQALLYFNEYEKLCRKNNDSLGLSVAYNEIGGVYYEIYNIEMALEYHKKNLELIQNWNNSEDLAICYSNLGNCYLDLKDYEKALQYYNESFAISQEINYLDNLYHLYWNLALVYKRTGDLEMAYQMLRKRNKMSDELFDKNLSKQIEELHTKYEVEKHEENIAFLEKENEFKDFKNKQKNIIIYISLALIVVIIVMFFFVYKNYKQKQKTLNLLAEQELEKSKQKLVDVIKNHEIEIVETALLSQNKERKRIAVDIHDRLGILLATIKLHFDSLNSLFAGKPTELKKFNTVNTLIDQACSDLRTIAHDIDSGNLSKFGLLHALGDLTKTIESAKKIRFEVQDYGFDKKIKNTAEIEIYRIIQELTTNIIKHANATEVIIQFTRHEKNLNILIEDDGIGFEPTKAMNKGMGLKNLYSRIDKLNGTLNIDSNLGKGTTIIIELTNVFKND
ncbi:tetratricopeptide repeat protein [Bacteroidota bacterium]